MIVRDNIYYIVDDLDYIQLKGKKSFSLADIKYGYTQIEISDDIVSVTRDGLGIKNLYFYSDDNVLVISNDIKKILYVNDCFGKKLGLNFQWLYNTLKYNTTLTFDTLVESIEVFDFWTKYRFSDWILIDKTIVDDIQFKINDDSLEANGFKYKSNFDTMIDNIHDLSQLWKIWVLYTWGLDSTLILKELIKRKSNIIAITAMQKSFLKEDDISAIHFCKENGIEHKVILHDDSDINLLPAVVHAMEDVDISMTGLSVTIKKILDFAVQNNIHSLISGSYIEPILWSNPQTLSFVKIFLQTKAKINWANDIRSEWVHYRFEQNYNYDFLSESVSVNDTLFQKMSVIYKNIFSYKEYWITEFSKDDFMQNISDQVGECDSIIPNYLSIKKLELYNILSYSDLAYRWHYRNSYVNERLSNTSGLNILHPFAHRSLRNTIFNLPIKQKFDPWNNSTTVRDNKFFVRSALKEYIPSELLFKEKMRGSIPSVYQWLYADMNMQNICRILKKLETRNIFRTDYICDYINLFTLYKKIVNLDQSVSSKRIVFDSRKIWNLITLEIFLTLYIDQKFDLFSTNFNTISLDDI